VIHYLTGINSILYKSVTLRHILVLNLIQANVAVQKEHFHVKEVQFQTHLVQFFNTPSVCCIFNYFVFVQLFEHIILQLSNCSGLGLECHGFGLAVCGIGLVVYGLGLCGLVNTVCINTGFTLRKFSFKPI